MPNQMANQMSYQMQPNMGQAMPINMNRPMNPNQSAMPPNQPNYAPNYEPFSANYQHNQPLLPAPMPSHQQFSMQNNYQNQFQANDGQRFPNQQNFNNMGYVSQQPFQNNITVHSNMSGNQMGSSSQPLFQQNQLTPPKRPNTQPTYRQNKPLLSATDQQKAEALKMAHMRTKRAKQLLTKKQNVVKEVPIVRNPVPTKTQPKKEDIEIEAAVGVDAEYKKKLEEQKRLREEVLRKKEERRKAMAAQRLKSSEQKSEPQQKSPLQKASSIRSGPQQQIATLLNRSPQPTTILQKQTATKRIVKPLNSENTMNRSNRVVVASSQNQNQKRSVLIKGLAASTSELTIRKLCRPIGAIESCKIAVNGGQKTATVTFSRAQDAIQFQSKHERTLLDLSIIQVSLIWFVSQLYYRLFVFDFVALFHSIESILTEYHGFFKLCPIGQWNWIDLFFLWFSKIKLFPYVCLISVLFISIMSLRGCINRNVSNILFQIHLASN